VTIAEAPHGRGRYQRGCRCATCKLANREYQRRHRTKQFRLVTPPPADVTPVAGPVEIAVRAQLEHLPSAEDRPGLVAIAIRLGQVMDTESAVPQFASAAKVLSEILSTLSKHSTRRTRLSVVRGMTDPK
jgi:hypothetical protein